MNSVTSKGAEVKDKNFLYQKFRESIMIPQFFYPVVSVTRILVGKISTVTREYL